MSIRHILLNTRCIIPADAGMKTQKAVPWGGLFYCATPCATNKAARAPTPKSANRIR
jgi:hypothetical protein